MKSHCKKILTRENTVHFRISYYNHLNQKKKKIHMLFIRYGGNGEVYPPPWNYPPLTRYYPYPIKAYLKGPQVQVRPIMLRICAPLH